jgi:hypothetical protein
MTQERNKNLAIARAAQMKMSDPRNVFCLPRGSHLEKIILQKIYRSETLFNRIFQSKGCLIKTVVGVIYQTAFCFDLTLLIFKLL